MMEDQLLDLIETRKSQRDFFSSFDTTYENWLQWTKTPEGTIAILKDPWKGEYPSIKPAKDILAKIRGKFERKK